jgi:hypothetical protein
MLTHLDLSRSKYRLSIFLCRYICILIIYNSRSIYIDILVDFLIDASITDVSNIPIEV